MRFFISSNFKKLSINWEKYIFHWEKWNFQHIMHSKHTAELLILVKALNTNNRLFVLLPKLTKCEMKNTFQVQVYIQ